MEAAATTGVGATALVAFAVAELEPLAVAVAVELLSSTGCTKSAAVAFDGAGGVTCWSFGQALATPA